MCKLLTEKFYFILFCDSGNIVTDIIFINSVLTMKQDSVDERITTALSTLRNELVSFKYFSFIKELRKKIFMNISFYILFFFWKMAIFYQLLN